MDECEEVDGASIEPCCETAEVLELVQASFDAVSSLVQDCVVRDGDFAQTTGGDAGDHAGAGDDLAQLVAVVGFVGDDGTAIDTIEKRRSGDDVMSLPACEDEAQRSPEAVGEHMNLGGQSSSGTPQSLILAPLFRSPPAGGREPGWCRA